MSFDNAPSITLHTNLENFPYKFDNGGVVGGLFFDNLISGHSLELRGEHEELTLLQRN